MKLKLTEEQLKMLIEMMDSGEDITCEECGWSWNTNDSEEHDKYVCHNCGFDNLNSER
jgi:DNA-directed RNA polymerase subunit RPC12/RpoP